MTSAQLLPGLSGDGARRLQSSDDRIVVVGAGGWLGLATLEALHQTLGTDFHRRVVCFGSNSRTLTLRGGLIAHQAALDEIGRLPPAPSLVLHFAFLTQEKAKAMTEADYAAANCAISRQVLAALDPIGATGVFVASSGAVYVADDESAEASKRLYGRLKLADEASFADWAQAGSRRTVIARVFNLAGPYMTVGGAYALAAFIADAFAGRAIAVNARSPVLRSYVAINELMSVVFGLLTDGEGPVIFDTAGEEVLEMNEVARVVAREIAPETRIERPRMLSDASDRYVGSGAAYQAYRQRFDVEAVDFPAQVRQTASFAALASKSR